MSLPTHDPAVQTQPTRPCSLANTYSAHAMPHVPNVNRLALRQEHGPCCVRGGGESVYRRGHSRRRQGVCGTGTRFPTTRLSVLPGPSSGRLTVYWCLGRLSVSRMRALSCALGGWVPYRREHCLAAITGDGAQGSLGCYGFCALLDVICCHLFAWYHPHACGVSGMGVSRSCGSCYTLPFACLDLVSNTTACVLCDFVLVGRPHRLHVSLRHLTHTHTCAVGCAAPQVVEVGGLRLLASPWSPEYAGVWQVRAVLPAACGPTGAVEDADCRTGRMALGGFRRA